MNDLKKWQRKQKAIKIVDVLNSKGYIAEYAENAKIAKQKVIDYIEPGSTIAFGGSVTLKEYGIIDHFLSLEYKPFKRYNQPDFDAEVECLRKGMLADYLLTGVNAITENGELVNRDSTGNRAAGIVFGPKHVVIVAGANKIVKNLDEAYRRIKEIAPLNCKRVGHKTPCSSSGICEECESKERMCNFTTIVHNGRKFGRYYVILTPDDIGF